MFFSIQSGSKQVFSSYKILKGVICYILNSLFCVLSFQSQNCLKDDDDDTPTDHHNDEPSCDGQ